MTKKKLKKMQAESVASYKRKIAWAKMQNPDEKSNEESMEEAIGIGWHGSDCSYCTELVKDKRNVCPLAWASKFEGHRDCRNWGSQFICCKGLWLEMVNSRTWAEWIIRAEKVMQYIINYGAKYRNEFKLNKSVLHKLFSKYLPQL
jgi:hypothetical protein